MTLLGIMCIVAGVAVLAYVAFEWLSQTYLGGSLW